jgi:DNA replication protein DnaC
MSAAPSPPGGTPDGPEPARRGRGCARCGGTGFELIEGPDGITRAHRCACHTEDRGTRALKSAGIPARYRACSFETFDELNDDLRLAKLQVMKFAEEYPIQDTGLLLLGSCGAGKTHLAVAALQELIRDKGVEGLFVDFRDLLKEIQASYNAVSEVTELDILQPIFGAEVLLLDDLGAIRMTEWVRDTLSHIISARYNERRVTIITSSMDDEPASQSGMAGARADERIRERPTLRDQIGDPLRSRLYEMCSVVRVKGNDYRLTVKHTARRPTQRL